LYRSNSQFSWRLCDATIGGHIGKGFHEYDKQLPIPVTTALLDMHDNVATLRSASESSEEATQPALARFLLRGLTEDAQSDRVIRTPQARYWSRDYAAYTSSEPMRFSVVGAWLKTPGNLRVADPTTVRLPANDKLPNVTHVVHVVRFQSRAYADLGNSDGQLSGKVFLSHDQTVRYLFFEDRDGRAVLSGVESLRAEINIFGIRSRYFDVSGMDAPLIEYYLQIPEEFGGSRQPGYCLNWNYVREQPTVRYYYQQQNRIIPPPIQQ
jgi:hypothetical protein